jgi:hypothetical protein
MKQLTLHLPELSRAKGKQFQADLK